MPPERRKYPRQKPDPSFSVTAASAEFEGPPSTRHNLAERIVDVSAKGACLVTVGRLREGIPLIVQIQSPDARFKAKAVVRWSQTLTHKGREAHVAGVEFMELLEAYGEKVAFMTVWARGVVHQALRGEDLRRQHRKEALARARVTLLPRGFWGALGFRSNVAKCLADIGAESIQIVCVKKLDAGSKVDLRLDFQNPATFVVGEAQVLSCKRDTLVLESKWDTDVVFTRLSPQDKARLDEVLRLFAP